MAELLPAIFFGHGNPMNALLANSYTAGWRRIGREVGEPKAVFSISAHWFVPETGVTVTTAPKTIHDFGGFPRELLQVQYPAPGDPALARRVQPFGAVGGQAERVLGAGSRDLVGADARLSGGGYSGGAAQHQRAQAGLFISSWAGGWRRCAQEGVLIVGSGNGTQSAYLRVGRATDGSV